MGTRIHISDSAPWNTQALLLLLFFRVFLLNNIQKYADEKLRTIYKMMNFRLVALTMASSVFVIVYAFGDVIKYLGRSGNLDQILNPMLGSFGWYLFEITVPFASIVLIFLSLREAYNEGKRDAQKGS